MAEENGRFDREAATWDEDPRRVRMAGEVVRAVLDAAAPASDASVLDFGCGTGLVALGLRPHVGKVTGADASEEMLRVLRGKAGRWGLSGVETAPVSIENPELPPGPFDLVVGNLVLHHVKDVAALLGRFHAVLKPGGVLALSDLDEEGGLFHPDPTGVHHNGFNREALRCAFEAAGFLRVADRTAVEVTKQGADGVPRSFTIFLMTGSKGI